MATATWRGAIEFVGFPVNIAIYSRVKSNKGGTGFRYLSGNKPVKQVYVTESTFEKLERDSKAKVSVLNKDTIKRGIETGNETFKALSEEAIEKINEAQRSTTVSPRTFVPLDKIDLAIADRAYVVIPDIRVSGADVSANQMWNGLRQSKLAYTTELTMRAGSRDCIFALYADDDGLWGVSIPFLAELTDDLPTYDWTKDAKAARMVQKFIEMEYPTAKEFPHAVYESASAKRRTDAIEATLKGTEPTIEEASLPPAEVPDLMAQLEQQVSDAKTVKSRKREYKRRKAPTTKKKAPAKK